MRFDVFKSKIIPNLLPLPWYLILALKVCLTSISVFAFFIWPLKALLKRTKASSVFAFRIIAYTPKTHFYLTTLFFPIILKPYLSDVTFAVSDVGLELLRHAAEFSGGELNEPVFPFKYSAPFYANCCYLLVVPVFVLFFLLYFSNPGSVLTQPAKLTGLDKYSVRQCHACGPHPNAEHVDKRCVPEFLIRSDILQNSIGQGNRSLFFAFIVATMLYGASVGQPFYSANSAFQAYMRSELVQTGYICKTIAKLAFGFSLSYQNLFVYFWTGCCMLCLAVPMNWLMDKHVNCLFITRYTAETQKQLTFWRNEAALEERQGKFIQNEQGVTLYINKAEKYDGWEEVDVAAVRKDLENVEEVGLEHAWWRVQQIAKGFQWKFIE